MNWISIVTLCASFSTFLSPISQRKERKEDTSNFTNLIVFAKFEGEEEFINNTYGDTPIRTIVDNMYNQSYYSLRNYFHLLSNEKVQMNSVFLLDENHSLTLSRSRGYYASYSETNPIGYHPGEEAKTMLELKEDWSTSINQVLKSNASLYSANGDAIYDTSILDKNHDGKIDSITILYKESPSNIAVDWASPLWNYQDQCSLVEVQVGQTVITSDKYMQLTNSYMESALYQDPQGLVFSSISTAAHEMGHIFGLKDLYRSGNDSRVYFMSAMAKHFSPIPQYISTKEREALHWLNDGQLKTIQANGTYKLHAVSEENSNETISYQLDLQNGKTAYFEYRNFNSRNNRFDDQFRSLKRIDGSSAIGTTVMKSGLVVFLVDTDTNFPNNMGTTGSHWNYEVLGGQYATKSDAALAKDEEISLTASIDVYVNEINENELTFSISGGDFIEITPPEITGIEITNHPTSLKRGETFAFNASIKGNHLSGEEKVLWTIKNNQSTSTVISKEGVLTIGNDESASSITITATTENGYSDEKEISLNIVHSLFHLERIEATCKEEGRKECWYCEECHLYFLNDQHQDAIDEKELILPKNENHEPKEVISYQESTCSSLGHTAKIICSICGLVLKDSQIIEKKPHQEEVILGKEATCEEEGLNDGIRCSICNEILKPQEIIPPKGHITSDVIIDITPTEEKEGLQHIECLTCHKILLVEKIDKLPKSRKNILPYVIVFSIPLSLSPFVLFFSIKKKRRRSLT